MTSVLWITIGLGRGGAERLLVDTAALVDRAEHDVTVAYVLPWKDALVEDLRGHGVEVRCVGRGRPPLDPRWVLGLRRLLRARRWDVVHTHSPLPAAVARLVAPRGIAFVHTEHNEWSRFRAPVRWLNARTWRRNQRVLAVSDAVAASIAPPRARRTPPPVEVVTQGIDPSAIARGPEARAEARRRLDLDAGVPVVGIVANLVPKKDHATFLDAVAMLARNRPLAAVVVGAGPLEADLRQRASASGADVRFLGSRADVPDLLAGFDVFCLSSRHEGLPIALLEAMSAGVPVVATTAGGIPEVVTHGVDGLLVAPGDASALAAALAKVLDDTGLAASLGAEAMASSSRYGLEHAVRRTEELYALARSDVGC